MTKDGKTASIIAMMNGNVDAMKLLVDPKTIDSKIESLVIYEGDNEGVIYFF